MARGRRRARPHDRPACAGPRPHRAARSAAAGRGRPLSRSLHTPFYPVSLRLEGRSCLVVGPDDPEAHDRARRLEAAGAVVRRRAPPIEAVALDAPFLVYVCASVPEPTAATIAREARARGTLVACGDRPALSDFAHPAVVRRGPVSIAVSTSGASPALSRRLRELLEGLVPERLGAFAEGLARLRQRVSSLPRAERLARLSSAVADVRLEGRLVLPRDPD